MQIPYFRLSYRLLVQPTLCFMIAKYPTVDQKLQYVAIADYGKRLFSIIFAQIAIKLETRVAVDSLHN